MTIPKIVREVLAHLGWRQAMTNELSVLHNNGTWALVPLLLGKSIVGCRWVFTIKVGLDGTIDRLKARLVAKRLYSNFWVVLWRYFFPVAKMTSIRLLIAMATLQH